MFVLFCKCLKMYWFQECLLISRGNHEVSVVCCRSASLSLVFCIGVIWPRHVFHICAHTLLVLCTLNIRSILVLMSIWVYICIRITTILNQIPKEKSMWPHVCTAVNLHRLNTEFKTMKLVLVLYTHKVGIFLLFGKMSFLSKKGPIYWDRIKDQFSVHLGITTIYSLSTFKVNFPILCWWRQRSQ